MIICCDTVRFLKTMQLNFELIAQKRRCMILDGANLDFILIGVPAQDRYYGRYAHKVGIPDHNPWIVFPTFAVLATAIHWLMSWHHYRIMMRAVKKSVNYKTKRYQNMQEAGLNVKAVKKLEKSIPDYEPADDDPYAPPIHIYGAEKPTLWDLLPITIVRGVIKLISGCFEQPV